MAPRPTEHCAASPIPDGPALTPGTSGDLVTLTVAEVKRLATYINRVAEAKQSLDGCNLIIWSPQ